MKRVVPPGNSTPSVTEAEAASTLKPTISASSRFRWDVVVETVEWGVLAVASATTESPSASESLPPSSGDGAAARASVSRADMAGSIGGPASWIGESSRP